MTFSNAVATMNPSGTTNNAAKIPSWHGYVYETTTGLTEEAVAAGQFKLIFVKAGGDQYVYTYDGVADYAYTGYIANNGGALGTGTPAPSTTLDMGADLLEALVSDAWVTGSQTYYDTNRTTDSEW